MSSILKALKKLETETGQGHGAAEPTAILSRQALRRRMKPPRRYRPWVAALLVLILFAGGGLFFKGDRLTPKTSTAARLDKKMPVPPLFIAKREKSAPSPVQATKQPDQSLLHVKKKTLPVSPGPAIGSSRKEPEKPLLAPAGDGATNARVSSLESKRMLPQAPDAGPAKIMPSTAAGVELTLQALAWASDPAGRFAVINSQITREGESVEGMRVERIEPERVILRKGGEAYQLTY